VIPASREERLLVLVVPLALCGRERHLDPTDVVRREVVAGEVVGVERVDPVPDEVRDRLVGAVGSLEGRREPEASRRGE